MFRFWAYRTLVFRKNPPTRVAAAVLATTPVVPVEEELAALGWQVPEDIEVPAELSRQRSSVR